MLSLKTYMRMYTRWMVDPTSKWMGRILAWQTCHIWQTESETCASVYSLKFFCSRVKTEQWCCISSTVWCHQTRMVTSPWGLTQRISHLRCPTRRHLFHPRIQLVFSYCLPWGPNAVVPSKGLGEELWDRTLPRAYHWERFLLRKRKERRVSLWRRFLNGLDLLSTPVFFNMLENAVGSHHNKLRPSSQQIWTTPRYLTILICIDPGAMGGCCGRFYSDHSTILRD